MNGQSNEERMEVRRRKLFSARIETIWNKTILSKGTFLLLFAGGWLIVRKFIEMLQFFLFRIGRNLPHFALK